MPKPRSKKPALDEIELHPDAWKRFEQFVETNVPKRPVAKATPSRPKATSRKRPKTA